MAESNLNERILGALHRLHPIRVENPSLPGTPDIQFIEGWIESKQVVGLPKRPETPLRIPHFTREQRGFLMHRVHAGGNAWVCLEIRVGHIVMLIRGDVAAQYLGRVPYSELVSKYASLVMAPWNDVAFLDFVEQRNPRRKSCLPSLAEFVPLVIGSPSKAESLIRSTDATLREKKARISHGPF